MNFLNIQKNKILRISFFSIFHVFFAFYAISNIKKKICGGCRNIFFYKNSCWLNGRWFLQIVDRDSGNLCPIYPPFPCSDFLSQMWGGGGGVFFMFFMLDLFPTFLDFFWKYLKVPLHLLVKWEVVSPNSR